MKRLKQILTGALVLGLLLPSSIFADSSMGSVVEVQETVSTLDSPDISLEALKEKEELNLENLTTIDMGSFINLPNLKSVTLSKDLKYIHSNGFSDCHLLSDINFPDGLEYIGEEAFFECNFSTVELPGSVKAVEHFAFYKNPNLSKVVINEGTEYLGSSVFAYNDNLKELHLPASLTQIGRWIVSEDLRHNVLVYAPEGSYAEHYCLEHDIPLANGKTEPDGFYPFEKRWYNDFRGFKPTENLAGTETKYFEMGHDSAVESGTYEVEIWDENTFRDYTYTNGDNMHIETGYIINIDGKYYCTGGIMNGRLTDAPSHSYEARDGLSWTFNVLRAPKEIFVKPHGYGYFKRVKGQVYTKDSPDFYGYYRYGFAKSTPGTFGYQPFSIPIKTVIVKFK